MVGLLDVAIFWTSDSKSMGIKQNLTPTEFSNWCKTLYGRWVELH